MTKFRVIAHSLIFFTLSACGQNKANDNYTDLEKKTEVCIDQWFESKKVSWTDLKHSFENYFSSSEITDFKDPVEKQYLDILSYIERPSRQFPIFKDKKKIIAIKNELGLTDQDIYNKNQLDCFTNLYIENKNQVDTTSSYYAFGATFEAIKQIPEISPGLLAGALKMSMNKEDLKKEIYQKTIILMFYFDFTLVLSDGND